MKNTLVVFNYNAGRKKAIFYKKIVQKFLLKKCTKFKFISVDEYSSINMEDYDTVFVVGGDGTVSRIIPYIINTDKTLAIIPCGTANLLASSLGMSSNIEKTLKIIEKNNIKLIDILSVNEKYCVLRCGFGYDSDIICKTPQSLKNKFGYFAYFIAGVIFALRLKEKQYKLSFDNKKLECIATGIIVANAANMYLNAVSVANKSLLDDKLIDVFILKAKNPIAFFYEFVRILFGIRKGSSRAEYFKASELNIQNNWCACHIDGEKTRIKGNIEIKIIPKAIRVYCK